MPITTREMSATPIVVGSRRYTPVAGDLEAKLRVPGGEFRAGYSRPIRIEIDDGRDSNIIRIPDRQLQIMLGAAFVVGIARLIERKGRT